MAIARSCLIRALTACALLLVLAPAAPAAEVRVEFRAGGTPVEPSGSRAPVPAKLTRPGPIVVLPYYVVDIDDPNGVTTFYAVRNRSDDTVTVRYKYYRTDRGLLFPSVVEIHNLGPNQTRSVNVRSIAGLPTEGGLATGYMVAEVLDSATMLLVTDSTALSGDFFRVDYGNAFASGGPLLAFGPLNLAFDFCQTWDLRFYNGGGFDGGTEIVFYVPYNAGGGDPVVSGNVYDEDGIFRGVVRITTADRAFAVTTSELDLAADFGTVEWVFAEGLVGNVSGIYSALGKFSVNTAAICGDALGEVDASAAESLAAEATAATVAVARMAYVLSLLSDGASLVWDPITGWWIATLDLPTGQHAELRLGFRDAAGNPHQHFDPSSTDTIAVESEASGENGSLTLYLAVGGLSFVSSSLTVDGNGTATWKDTTGAFAVENLALPKIFGAYPESGIIRVTAGSVEITVEFDGSRYAQGSYTTPGGTVNFTIDLETGEIVGL